MNQPENRLTYTSPVPRVRSRREKLERFAMGLLFCLAMTFALLGTLLAAFQIH